MSDGSGVGTLIPRVFYDIIGRILPGFVLIASGYVVTCGTKHALATASHFVADARPSAGHMSAIIPVLGIGSYMLAVLLSGVADALKLKVRLNKPWKGDELGIRAAIELQLPAVGDRLTKIRAERNMCEVLLVGWFAMIVWCLIVHTSIRPMTLQGLARTECVLVVLVALAQCAQAMFRRNLVKRLDQYKTMCGPEAGHETGDARTGEAKTGAGVGH